jgi:hypothetical protein
MIKVFSRRANDDFEAEQRATAMINAGCIVISIAFAGMHRLPGAIGDTARFVVFAQYAERKQIDSSDEAFDKWLNSLTPQKP